MSWMLLQLTRSVMGHTMALKYLQRQTLLDKSEKLTIYRAACMHLQIDIFNYEKLIGAYNVCNSHWTLLVS